MHILGTNGNRTDLNVQLHPLNDPAKETIFENCVADVNIPVGEVFTSPVLEGTNGVLHVSKVYLNELQYRDLEITFSNGMYQSITVRTLIAIWKIKRIFTIMYYTNIRRCRLVNLRSERIQLHI